MPAAFPAALKLMRDGFGKEPESVVNRTAFDDGMVKQAKAKTRALVARPVVYAADSKTDFDAFETFVNTTLNGGADWFNWTDPYDSVVKLARIVNGANGPYRALPINGALNRWEISMRIETWSA
jgi:hypothetical protein